MLFKTPSAAPAAVQPATAPWRVLIVDDEPEVRTITRLALADFEYLGRRLEFVNADSAAQARALLARADDIALAFVDVVMETDTAGLDLVTHIRKVLGNHALRIVLRTGQPGMAPERKVIRDHDINDYMHKTQSSADKLYTTTLTALRAYADIKALEDSRGQLERYRDGLEMVVAASTNLFAQRSLRLFASGLLSQLGALLKGTGQSVMLRANGVTVAHTDGGFEVLARSGRFDHPADGDRLAPAVVDRLNACLAARRTIFEGDVFVGYFPTSGGIVNLLYLDGVPGAGSIDLRLLDIFSKNISVAFENLYLDRELFETQSDIIATLGEVVETRSKEAANHVQRVRHLAQFLAELAGLDEVQCRLIYMASPMHDIGKVAIPDSILLKPGALTPDEWTQMKRHAQVGEEVFGRSTRPMLRAASTIAGQHHEKFDGSGYPRGLAGADIHIFARIVAVVDVFDALIHKRCYKEPWPLPRVLELLRAERGKHFDPQIVDLLIANIDGAAALVARYPDASTVHAGAPAAAADALA